MWYNNKNETERKSRLFRQDRCFMSTLSQNQDGYGNDFLTLTDDEGNQLELEHLDTLEYEGV